MQSSGRQTFHTGVITGESLPILCSIVSLNHPGTGCQSFTFADRATCASGARTCKAWLSPALDGAWVDMDRLIPVLALIATLETRRRLSNEEVGLMSSGSLSNSADDMLSWYSAPWQTPTGTAYPNTRLGFGGSGARMMRSFPEVLSPPISIRAYFTTSEVTSLSGKPAFRTSKSSPGYPTGTAMRRRSCTSYQQASERST